MVGGPPHRPDRAPPPTAQIVLSDEAVADLERLDLFLRDVSPRAADRLGIVIQHGLQTIAASPGIGRPKPYRPPDQDHRERLVRLGRSTYVLSYHVTPGVVTILRIHHSREDRDGGLEG